MPNITYSREKELELVLACSMDAVLEQAMLSGVCIPDPEDIARISSSSSQFPSRGMYVCTRLDTNSIHIARVEIFTCILYVCMYFVCRYSLGGVYQVVSRRRTHTKDTRKRNSYSGEGRLTIMF